MGIKGKYSILKNFALRNEAEIRDESDQSSEAEPSVGKCLSSNGTHGNMN